MRLLRAALAFATAATFGAPTHLVGAQAPVGSTTIILVRHAEKAVEPAADPALTAAGTARAEALIDVVKDAGVKAIVSTQFARTRGTAAPAAAKLGIVPEIADARAPDHVRAVADSLLAHHRGETILVVGHSNTVPAIIAALGAPAPAPICDAEYDNIYVVVVPPSGKATVTHAHYGAPSPPDTSCRRM
jgi:broad specificity phosphatase PhoE